MQSPVARGMIFLVAGLMGVMKNPGLLKQVFIRSPHRPDQDNCAKPQIVVSRAASSDVEFYFSQVIGLDTI